MNFLNALLNGITNGLREILAHKFRSLLTMSGIILGVAALVAMVSVIQGMMASFRTFFEETGGVERISISRADPPPEQANIAPLSPGRTMLDARALAASVPLAAAISPKVGVGNQPLQHGNKRDWMGVTGCTPDILPVERLEVAEGRFLGDLDIEHSSQVVVIGTLVRDHLFNPNESPLDQIIKIRGTPFRVIGVMKQYGITQPDGRNPLGWKNRGVYIPITTAIRRFTGSDQLTDLNVKVDSVEHLNDIVPQIENTLHVTHRGVSDFSVDTTEEALQELAKVERQFTFSLGGVAAISLLVGGIGIMNVMLAVINERIREIGVRKAVGARAGDIFVQFLAEAMVLSVCGGLIGLSLSIGLVTVMGSILSTIFNGKPITVPVGAMMLGFFFSVGTGIISGIYPALKAARLDPIEALRYE